MRIVQSFWSKPFSSASTDPGARYKAGWSSQAGFFYASLLSCLKWREFYGDVILYTDDHGKKLLSEQLQLPYSEIRTDLNRLDEYPPELWALGKILTYSLQEEPFLHADSDVFIWKKLPEALFEGQLFAQNVELNFPRYQDFMAMMTERFENVSGKFPLYAQTSDCYAFNAGIFGGSEYNFFKKHKEAAFDIVKANLDKLQGIDSFMFNMVYEQLLSFEMANGEGLDCRLYKSHMNEAFTDVMKFHVVPAFDEYIHTIGYAKRSNVMNEQIKYRLRHEYPVEYEALNRNMLLHGLALAEDIQDDIARFATLERLFTKLEALTGDELLASKFRLSPNVVIENDEVRYISPQTGCAETLIMEDWDFLLYQFDQPRSASELTLELLQDEAVAETFSPELLAQKVFSFMMDHCMYNGILEFDN
ncbi:DUF6734 family protein [Flavobacterium silvaticum]|uniref:DUF6734 domain-containing protein n=1 Tax=Flavobacterium silvaticum TaxID=1852020 RepID=A0A972G057_9FLAO|nr:DUF6734 family protein [Flavobacterium silvaticum]NMH28011.1 hypothetical protein [Flavobacterium silvaticum]